MKRGSMECMFREYLVIVKRKGRLCFAACLFNA